MKNKITILLAVIILTSFSGFAQIIDLTTSTTGTVTGFAQSFNENRAVDVTVLSTHTIHLTSMSIHRYWTGGDGTANLSARIYNSGTQALLYSHDTTVYNINDGTVNVPISYILDTGSNYRISFYSSGPNSDNAGNMFQPNSFPYIDSTNQLRINQAYDVGSDTFPDNFNIFVPIITMTYDTNTITTSIPVIGSLESNINVFPNPSNGNLTLSNLRLMNYDLRITDVFGRTVYSQPIINQTQSTIQLNQIPPGIYYWEMISDKGIEGTGKIVLIRN